MRPVFIKAFVPSTNNRSQTIFANFMKKKVHKMVNLK